MAPRTKTNPSESALEQRLRADRDRLVAKIADLDGRIDGALTAAGATLARISGRGRVDIESSAVEGVVSLRAQKEALQRTVEEIDRNLAAAPARQREFDAAKARLATAIEARKAVQNVAEGLLRELHAALMRLRAVNIDAFAAGRDAYRAWAACGREPAERPAYPTVRWDPELWVLFRAVPFLRVELTGDTSDANARLYSAAGVEGDLGDFLEVE